MVSTLYEWAGGESAYVRLINAFYDRVEADDLLAPLFPGGVLEEHRDHVVAWWCEVFGGPDRYTRGLGGYERMLAKHRDLAITSEQRSLLRFVSLISDRSRRGVRLGAALRRNRLLRASFSS